MCRRVSRRALKCRVIEHIPVCCTGTSFPLPPPHAPPQFQREYYLLLTLTPQDLKIELDHRGAVSDAACNGEAVNVRAGVGGSAPSMLCMPVYGADGLVAGVVQVVGKKSNGKALDSG